MEFGLYTADTLRDHPSSYNTVRWSVVVTVLQPRRYSLRTGKDVIYVRYRPDTQKNLVRQTCIFDLWTGRVD